MKKTFTTSFLFMLSVFIFAGGVPIEKAREVAKNFYAHQTMKKSAQITIISEFLLEKNNTPAIHVFNFSDEKGFVLVSASDNTLPILAYSEKGSFTGKNMPEALKTWIENYKIQIEAAENAKKNQTVKAQWEIYLHSESTSNSSTQKGTAIEPLLGTIEWDQDAGWNEFAPEHTGGPDDKAYAGCVATATGMVMKYYEYPDQGQGSHSYAHTVEYGHDVDFGTLSADFSGTYDWSAMSNSAPSSEAAKLLYHIGVAIEMDFSKEGSGAFTTDAMNALKRYFGYDANATYKFKEHYTDEAWIEMIRQELEAGRPVLYNGSGADFGHAFVCDGINTNNYFHFNWGWSGYYNGYYYVTNLNPGGDDLSENQGGAFGLMPDDASVPEYTVVEQLPEFNGTARGINNFSVIDQNIVWAYAYDGSGDDKTILEMTKTVDGGENWTASPINIPEGVHISMMQALSADVAWIAAFKETTTGGIFHTSDGGATWDQIPNLYSDASSFPNVIHFFNEQEGFVQGDPIGNDLECYYTSDGGANWTAVADADMPDAVSGEYGTTDLYAATDNYLYFSTNKGRVFKSGDKGKTWSTVQTPLTAISLITFSSDNFGIVGLYDSNSKTYTYYYTSDGSVTWNLLEYTGIIYNAEIRSVPGVDNVLFSCGNSVSYSTDFGKSWTQLPEFQAEYNMEMAFANINHGWIGNFNNSPTLGGILKYTGNNTLASFVYDKAIECTGKTITFTDKSFSQNTISSYEWNFGADATPSTATGIGPHEVSFASEGLKKASLKITDDQGQVSTKNADFEIEILEGVVSDFTYEVQGARTLFTNASTNAKAYTWNFGDGDSDITANPMHDYTNNGSYTVSLTAVNDICTDEKEQTVEITSVEILKLKETNLKVFPIPASNYIYIEGVKNLQTNIKSEVFDISGKKVSSLNSKANTNTIAIPVSQLAKGIYILKLSIDNQITETRFIKD